MWPSFRLRDGMERDVQRLDHEEDHTWLESLDVDAQTRLTVRRTRNKLSTRVRLRRKNRSVLLPRELFEARSAKYPTILRVGKFVGLFFRDAVYLQGGITLTRKLFEKMRNAAHRWLHELVDAVMGEALLEAEYRSGSFKEYVFCLSSGVHWTLTKYIDTLLLPLCLRNFMNYVETPDDEEHIAEAVYTLTTHQIFKMQQRFGHFDYTVSTDWLLHLIHTDPSVRERLANLIDGLGLNELSDLLHLTSAVFYSPPCRAKPLSNLKRVAARCKDLRSSHGPENWHYVDVVSGEHFVDDGSLGWMLVQGDVQLLNHHFGSFDWRYPDHILKGYFTHDSLTVRPYAVEICVFRCKSAKFIVRHGGRVIATSGLYSLSKVLRRLSGEAIILDRASLKCRCILTLITEREISKQHDTLQCLAARAYKREYYRANREDLALLPPFIKNAFFSRCSVGLQLSDRSPCLSASN